MKKLLVLIACMITVTVFGQLPEKPSPPRLVNDLTGKFLNAGEIKALEDKLMAYDDTTSNQIAVVVVDNLGNYSAADYAVELGRKWGVGNKDFNNGIVLLVSTGGGQGNRDAFIATGYGLEGVVSDLTASYIVDDKLIPNFKAGNYFQGINESVDAIIEAAAGRYKAPDNYKKGSGKGSILPVIIIVIVLVVLLSSSKGNDDSDGGYVSRKGYNPWPWIGGGLGGGGFGGGGGWSGGGGGGFGGFGGGGFGGGGAGGKW